MTVPEKKPNALWLVIKGTLSGFIWWGLAALWIWQEGPRLGISSRLYWVIVPVLALASLLFWLRKLLEVIEEVRLRPAGEIFLNTFFLTVLMIFTAIVASCTAPQPIHGPGP